jgi:hypothetical protein
MHTVDLDLSSLDTAFRLFSSLGYRGLQGHADRVRAYIHMTNWRSGWDIANFGRDDLSAHIRSKF